MGISINIAIHLARIAPLVQGYRTGVMFGRQKMHFRPPERAPLLLSELKTLGIEATPQDLFQEDGFVKPICKPSAGRGSKVSISRISRGRNTYTIFPNRSVKNSAAVST